MADRSSDSLKWARKQIKRVAPFAYLFSIAFGLLALFFSGLEKLSASLSDQAKLTGSKVQSKDKTDGALISFAKAIREASPFLQIASIVLSIFAIFFTALQAAAAQIEARADLVEEEKEEKEERPNLTLSEQAA